MSFIHIGDFKIKVSIAIVISLVSAPYWFPIFCDITGDFRQAYLTAQDKCPAVNLTFSDPTLHNETKFPQIWSQKCIGTTQVSVTNIGKSSIDNLKASCVAYTSEGTMIGSKELKMGDVSPGYGRIGDVEVEYDCTKSLGYIRCYPIYKNPCE